MVDCVHGVQALCMSAEPLDDPTCCIVPECGEAHWQCYGSSIQCSAMQVDRLEP
jgi:hypothetical protein